MQHLSQFLQAPQIPHMLAAIHVLRYLSAVPDLGILLSNSSDCSLIAYADSDWATCAQSRRSITGYYITLGGCPISWKSNKQPTIFLSSAEVEYRALNMVVAEISWLIRILADLGLLISSPIPIYCDRKASLHIARNPIFHERTKHIEIDCHYVRDSLHSGLVSLHFVPVLNKWLIYQPSLFQDTSIIICLASLVCSHPQASARGGGEGYWTA